MMRLNKETCLDHKYSFILRNNDEKYLSLNRKNRMCKIMEKLMTEEPEYTEDIHSISIDYTRRRETRLWKKSCHHKYRKLSENYEFGDFDL